MNIFYLILFLTNIFTVMFSVWKDLEYFDGAYEITTIFKVACVSGMLVTYFMIGIAPALVFTYIGIAYTILIEPIMKYYKNKREEKNED